MFREVRDLGRLAHVARVLARHRALVPPAVRDAAPAPLRLADKILSLGAKPASAASDDTGEAHGKRLAKALEKLGPAYIKLGQLLATRADLVGPSVARGLAGLHDHVPAFDKRLAESVIAAEFSRPSSDLFEDLGEPVAAASIAQVHKTCAKGAGEYVAVKILRPGIDAAFRRDIDSLYTAAALARRFNPSTKRLKPQAVVKTLDESIRREMDLRIEAAAASEFAENTAYDDDFRVPKVDWERTSARVLTTEWIDGIPLSDKDRLNASGVDRSRLGRIVLQSFLRHAMRDGFFHADMHPGNLFVDSEERLVAVDFGIMGRLDRRVRRFTADMLHGFITRDYIRVAEVHFEAGYVPKHHSKEEFALALRAVGEPIWGRPVSEMSMGRLLTQLFDTTRRFDMELQPSLLLLQKTMIAAEGVARDLDPNLSIWDCAKPVVEEWMETELGPEAALRDTVETLKAATRLLPRAPELLAKLEDYLDAEKAPEPDDTKSPQDRLIWLLGAVSLVLLVALIAT